MTAATAEKLWNIETAPSATAASRSARRRRASAAEAAPPAEYAEKARQVSADLARVALDETLRDEIAEQVHMLEGELKKRAERLASIEEAIVLQRAVEARRARRRAGIGRKIGVVGSGLLAAMFTGLMVLSVF
jgi:hypothetical protein